MSAEVVALTTTSALTALGQWAATTESDCSVARSP